MSCNVSSASFTFTTEFEGAASDLDAAQAAAAGLIVRALRVDPDTGDIVHDGNRLQYVSGIDAVAQALRTRLAFFRGEWFLDEEFGVPYFQSILGKQSALVAIREIFRGVILGTAGVQDVLSLELKQGDVAREFTLSFTVNTDLGELSLEVSTEV